MSNYVKVSELPKYDGKISENKMIFLVAKQNPLNGTVPYESKKIVYEDLISLMRGNSGNYGFKGELSLLNEINSNYVKASEIFYPAESSEKIDPAVLPSYVSDISVFHSYEDFPERPEKIATIFIDESTNQSYRYDVSSEKYWRVGDYSQWKIHLKYNDSTSEILSSKNENNIISLDISSKLDKDLSGLFAEKNHTHERFNDLSNYETVSSFVYTETSRLQNEIDRIVIGEGLPPTFLSVVSTSDIYSFDINCPIKFITLDENNLELNSSFTISNEDTTLTGAYNWELFLKAPQQGIDLSVSFNNGSMIYVGNEELVGQTLSLDISKAPNQTFAFAVRKVPSFVSSQKSWQINYEYCF